MILKKQNASSYLRAVFDNLEDELLVIGNDNRIIEANEAVLRNHGKQRQNIIGQLCYEVSHGLPDICHAPYHECPIREVWETGKPHRVTHAHIYEINGEITTRFLDIIASPIKNKDGDVIAVVELLRDVTAAKETENQLTQAHRNLLALNTIAATVSQSLNLDVVLNTALDRTLEVMHETIGGILLWDEEKQALRYRVHRGLSSNYVKKMKCRVGEGIAGLVAQKGEAILVEDISADHRVVYPTLIASEQLSAFASVPLKSKEHILGVLNIFSHEPRKFKPEDIQLLSSIATQIAVALENAQLHHEIQRKDAIRGDLLREIFSVQEEERRRIARELHDETSQSLASLVAHLEATSLMLPGQIQQAKTRLQEAANISVAILDEIHRLIYELRPSLLDDLGLVAASRWLADNNLAKAGIHVDFQTKGRLHRLTSPVEATLFRVIQEAVSNIAKHSHAKKASIIIIFDKDMVKVRIKDDGIGFDVKHATASKIRPKGLGIVGMKERVELINGNITIASNPNKKGTAIEIEIPLGQGGTNVKN